MKILLILPATERYRVVPGGGVLGLTTPAGREPARARQALSWFKECGQSLGLA